MTALEHNIMIDIVQKFADVCRAHNIPYMMYSGTLLGSYRHHDIIPWDDDADVFVDLSHRSQLIALLTTQLVQPMSYGLRDSWPRIKLWSPRSQWRAEMATGSVL
jgi:lipopolysaccharide cholinephosphotransferase